MNHVPSSDEGVLKEILVKEPEEITQNQNNEKQPKFLIPKKKPIIAGINKKDKFISSKYYNKKDFKLAKKAISEMKKANWPVALKTAKKAKDKSIFNFIQWRHLLTKGNNASYYDYKIFIDRNKNALVMAIASHVTLQNAKNFLINKMSEIQSVGHFLRTSTGYKVTSPEGYVAVDKVAGAVKLVDRLEFSRANFTMPKGWSN